MKMDSTTWRCITHGGFVKGLSHDPFSSRTLNTSLYRRWFIMTNSMTNRENEAKEELKKELRNMYKIHARLARECYHDGSITFDECLAHIIGLRDWLADCIDAVEEDRICDIRKPFY